ncbi:MAG: hypothetical protein RL511_216, partial [Bacteroidota bacterium]
MKSISFVLFSFLFSLSVFAQTGSLSGVLTNAANGTPISPAKVTIVELQLLKAVDLEGRFAFSEL